MEFAEDNDKRSEAEVKTAEQWATELGHLPAFTTPPTPKDKPRKVMRPIHNPEAVKYLQAKNFHTWPVGKELTKAEYIAAVEAARTHVFR